MRVLRPRPEPRGARDPRWEALCRATDEESTPFALVDLDAFESNVDALVQPVRAAGKHLRIASKSLRSIDLIERAMKRGGPTMKGVMAFTAREASFLAERGFDDVLVAYPTLDFQELRAAALSFGERGRVMFSVDDEEHVRVAARVAEDIGRKLSLVIDVDMSLRAAGGRVHVGVRRSPLFEPRDVADFAERIALHPRLVLAGLLGYEAHVAGVPDRSAGVALLDPLKRAMKRRAEPAVKDLRRAIVDALAARDLRVPLFNGGGTGSVAWSAGYSALTEVTAGSGFLDSHLFDNYDGLSLKPAAFFALSVTRRPAPGFVTCQGGGYVASGAAGADRLPRPWMPPGLKLTGLEGAGEVQTPLVVPDDLHVPLGTRVFFRHAKAGELAEHFTTYLLVRGDAIVGRAETYRGSGRSF